MTDPAVDTSSLSGFPAVTLDEVLTLAPALVRVDRKYLVDRHTARSLLAVLAESAHRVLEIDGRRATSYTSRYFDTDDLASCRAHLQGRRRRWKVRRRVYREDRLSRIEVKTRDRGDVTAKAVRDSALPAGSPEDGALHPDDAAFVEEVLTRHGFAVPVADLRATMTVDYRRSTFADLTTGSRVTLDSAVRCTFDGRSAWVDDGYLIVETKGGVRPGVADRALLRLGARPRSLSKYASTASLLRDDLADNAVRRLHGVQLHTERSVAS